MTDARAPSRLQLERAKRDMLLADPDPDEIAARKAYIEAWEFKRKGFSMTLLSKEQAALVVATVNHATASGFRVTKPCVAACASHGRRGIVGSRTRAPSARLRA